MLPKVVRRIVWSIGLIIALACSTLGQPTTAAPTIVATTPPPTVSVVPTQTPVSLTPTGSAPSANDYCAGDQECSRIRAIVEANPKTTRPIRVSTESPSCPQPVQNQSCGIWANGNHAFVTAYANQWTASAEFNDSFPIDAGSTVTFDHADSAYVYVLDSWGEKITFKSSEVTFTAPTPNVPGKQIYYWTVPVLNDWGAAMRSDTVPGTYPCYSYGLEIQFSQYEFYENADALMATGTNPTGHPSAYVGKDDFVSCQVLQVVKNNEDGSIGGAWVMIDGMKLWSRFIYFNYWPDSFWAKNHIQPPQ